MVMKKWLVFIFIIANSCIYAQIPTHCDNITSPIAFQSTDVSQCYSQACLNAHITTISGTPTTICTGWFPFFSTDFRQLFCALVADSGSGGSGTVTSVGLTGTNVFTYSGTPITTAGTFTIGLPNETGFLYNNAGVGSYTTVPQGTIQGSGITNHLAIFTNTITVGASSFTQFYNSSPQHEYWATTPLTSADSNTSTNEYVYSIGASYGSFNMVMGGTSGGGSISIGNNDYNDYGNVLYLSDDENEFYVFGSTEAQGFMYQSNTSEFGDVNDNSNGSVSYINDPDGEFNFTSNSNLANAKIDINNSTGISAMGDITGSGNYNGIYIDDNTGEIAIWQSIHYGLDINSTGGYGYAINLGDILDANNGYGLIINDNNEFVQLGDPFASKMTLYITPEMAYFYVPGNGTLGVNTTSPNPSAALDVESDSQGFLAPQMTTAQKNAIVSPKEGLMVYDLTLHNYYYFNGTIWTIL